MEINNILSNVQWGTIIVLSACLILIDYKLILNVSARITMHHYTIIFVIGKKVGKD